MNKNPFLPTPSFTPQHPPLPPGPPPPPQPSQPDYSTWWANAAAQPPHVQPPVGPYNTQWTPPQPPRLPAEQSALYANYGYGSQNNHWQRQQQQQQQQQQQYHPPPQPPPPPTQPAYNPYQPTAGYPQQYVPQPGPPPQQMVHPYPHPPTQPQHFFPPPIAPQGPQHQHQQPQQSQPRHVHQAPPQHLPPAKRQRFDGPNNNNNNRHHQNQPPPQPQFQPPPAPPQSSGNFSAPSGPNRGGIPSGPGGRGGGPTGPRGGGVGARGRGGLMSGNRGGLPGGRGRGSGSFVGGGGGRGGSGGGPSNGSLRGHGSRNNFGGGNNRRGGGSFTGSGGTGYSHQGGSSFRGRNQGHMSSNRGNRLDGGSGSAFGSREGPLSSSFGGKKDENRRTLTDFKIVGLAIPDLSWAWGIIPSLSPVKAEGIAINVDGQGASSAIVKEEALDNGSSIHAVASSNIAKETQTEVKAEVPIQSTKTEMTDIKPLQDTMSNARASSETVSPPSRIRIYFHTPVTADDSRPIPHNSAYGDIPSDSRKGKRKKLEDDEGDLEERRAPPPPPQMGVTINDDQMSITASVAETASEGDWLMAAIVEGEEEGSGATGDIPSEDDEDSDQLHVSEIIKNHEDDDSIDDNVTVGDTETFVDGNPHDDLHMTGAELDALGSSAAFGTMDDNPKVAEAATENALFAISSGQVSTIEHINGDHTTDPNAAADSSEQLDMVTSDGIVAIPPLVPEVHDSSVSASLISSSSQNVVVSAESADDYSADHPEYLETQVFEASSQNSTSKPLDIVSTDSTLPNMEETTQSDEAVLNNLNGAEPYGTQTMNDANDAGTTGDHLPEPPASPSDDTSSPLPLVRVDAGVVKTPSASRLSISYSRGNRRFVVDVEVVESVNLFRQEGRIEVTINVDKNADGSLKGILVEGLSDVTKSYLPLPTDPDASMAPDITVPPFSKVPVPSALKLFVYLDTARPLSEPKWAKTGDIQDWLKSMFGRMFWVTGGMFWVGDAAAEGWEKKIHVVDPDPPPTIWTVLDGWSTNSPVGVLNERQRFLKTHMTETDNILEILLRLVRGERATPFSQSAPVISAPSVSGPLLSAFSQGSAHGAQQTHVSLAVLAMFRLTVDYAKKALGDKGKGDAEERMGEIIRCLPSHLIYKSLDGIFKEWRVEKKGR